ncbi:ABC transporter substrate-binding protein [Methylocystis parvus]|uniref:ABC transporter substrate-binding protein n=1 Tax=Methylocystis parvus TaxID=134 RepID=A0A6B8M2T7_9HYPH|nr:ABC transporter substrate-binding protein [Methylocystis parvus]QGM98134.1 ABC transporter substrate-binding protein [Methylocystis parvus]WBK01545.1 ABC transporter substrate-binding protein [Methylocystis parvus OBBP]
MNRFARLLLAILSFATPCLASAREIVDMAGRHVAIPDKIARVYGSSPPATLMIYALAPEMMIGLNTPYLVGEKSYLRKEAANLPALGSQAGFGRTLNPEEVMSRHPDVVIAWLDRFVDSAKAESSFSKMGLPVVFVKLDTLADYPATFRFLGDLFGKKEKAEALAAYVEDAQAGVKRAVGDIPAAEKLRVYYAESPDGLATDCDKSFHAEPIVLAGGDNVYHCGQANHMGMEKIALEQIVAFRPEIILAQDRSFAGRVMTNPFWRNVPAAKDGKVFYIPHEPFNWLDRPPSYMRALGIQWLANLFYPNRFPLDLKAETKKFYSFFLGVEIDDADVDRILGKN